MKQLRLLVKQTKSAGLGERCRLLMVLLGSHAIRDMPHLLESLGGASGTAGGCPSMHTERAFVQNTVLVPI